jgi:hypothetical protein
MGILLKNKKVEREKPIRLEMESWGSFQEFNKETRTL